MNKIKNILSLGVLTFVFGQAAAFGVTGVTETLYSTYGQAVSTSPTFDLTSTSRLSIQVTYSSATHANVSFTDGTKSTSTITVGTDFALLAPATAFATITVSSNSVGALDGASININGHPFRNGIEWTRQDTATGTATSLSTAINSALEVFISTNVYGGSSSDTVRSSSTVAGTFANSYTIVTSTPAALSVNGSTLTASSTFGSGRNAGTLTINNVTLTAATDFTVGATTAAVANSIAAAINANSTLASVVVATAPLACSVSAATCGIVKSTAIAPGINNYALSTSSYPILTPSGSQFGFGVASDLDSANDIITKANTLTLGQGAWIGTTAPTGLTASTTYYAIPVVYGTSFKLSDTSTGAVAGVVVNISSTSGAGGTYTLTASSTTQGSSFVLQESNDGTNWVTAPSTNTVTVGIPSGTASVLYDAGFTNVKYLRLNFTAPTRGGMGLSVIGQSKKDN